MTAGERLGDVTGRRPAAVLGGAVAFSIIALLFVLRLHADTGMANLFPRHDPATVALGRWLERFPSGGDVLVLATLPDDAGSGRDTGLRPVPGTSGRQGSLATGRDSHGPEARVTAEGRADPAPLLAFGDRLSKELAGRPDVDAVVYRVDAAARRFVERVVAPAGIYYLSDAQYAEAKRRLTRAGMAEQLRQDEAMLAAPGPAAGALAAALLRDPLHLHEFLLAAMNRRRPTGGGGGAVLSPDGRSLLVRVIGRTTLGDVAGNRRLVAAVTAAATGANTMGLTVEVSGGPAIAAFDATKIRQDCIVSVVSSVALLQGLFVLAYRRPARSFVLALVPVGVGILWGFGGRGLLGWPIAPTAAVVAAVLTGMGIDYPVLYLPHYAAARAEGLSAADAVRRTTATLLSPLTAACATSLFGFAAVGLSSVPALRDFAVVGSMGLVGTLVAAVTVLPAMLVLVDRRTEPGRVCLGPASGTGVAGTSQSPRQTRTALAPGRHGPALFGRPRFTVGPVLDWAVFHRRGLVRAWVVVLIGAVVVIATMPGPLLPFESDLTALHPKPNPPLAAAADISRRMGVDPGSMSVYLHASSADDLVRLAYAVDRRLATPAVRAAGVVGTIGLSSLLPDPAVVAARRQDFSAVDVERVIGDFRAAVGETSFDPAAFGGYETFLRHTLSGPAAPSVGDLVAYPRLAESMLSRDEMAGRGDATEAVTLLLVDRPLDRRPDRVAAVSAVRAALGDLPGATLTGIGGAGLAAEGTVARDLPRLVGVVVLLNGLFLLGQFRSWRLAGLALLPAVVSLTLRLAVARVSGLEWNLINLVALPLLIGIDVDYGIYLVSLARGPRARERVATSGHSVVVSAAGNVLGFASLATTAVPAVRSLGWAVAVGVALCLAGTLFLLVPVLVGGKSNRMEAT